MRDQETNRRSYYTSALAVCLSFITAFNFVGSVEGQTGTISGPAYQLINQRTATNQGSFFVDLDQDSGFNRGFPSGFFASTLSNLATIHIDSGCISDLTTATGCSTDPNVLDRVRGTVLRVSFDAQAPGNFAGVNIEEPENWGAVHQGTGYDLRGAINVSFDVRSPNGAVVQFGVGGCNTPYTPIPSTWSTVTIALNSSALTCTPDLSDVHILFAVATNDFHSPQGATVLLDNIQFTPVPTARQSVLGFPLGNQTFGVFPQENTPIPSDQVLRNLTTIYESSLAEITLLARGTTQDLTNAKQIADTFDYALHHDSHGDPLPVALNGSVALHNGYENGDIALFNSQFPPKAGQAGDIRLAGFTATSLCATTGYCLVLDGGTGGNNAFAILAQVAAYEKFGDVRYLNDAVTIGNWIVGNLQDTSGTGYGGYFVGYPDEGVPPPKPLQTGKSIENNADIFAAFTALATVESQLGNSSAASTWTAAANVAGDFVMQMFDSTKGRFNVGTVPAGTTAATGLCPTGLQKGNDVINVCDFLDSNTFTTLAMAGAPRYQGQIDWRRPVLYALNNFAQTVTVAGTTYKGFDIVPTPDSGSNGIAWEFTGQVVEAMIYVDKLYSATTFESSANTYLEQISQAQTLAPFGDGLGLVAATLQDGEVLVPSQQCLQTPYQCIAERVGLAASLWAILAEQKLNVFNPFPSINLPQAASPFFNLAGGTYNTPHSLTLTDSTPGAVIYYTYTPGGSTPTTSSTVYSGAITINTSGTVEAIALAPGFTQSHISSKAYVFVALSQAAAPRFSLAGGTYSTPQSLTLTDTTAGAVIHYTTNGISPTASSTVYTAPITIASAETVEAVAIAPGFSLSPVSSKAYTYNPLPQTASPFFSLAGGHYTTPQTLSLTDSTPGAVIYYTTNGTVPTTASTLYTVPITISASETVIAIAVSPAHNNSNPSAKAYTIP